MILEKLEKMEGFTHQEKAVAAYILEHVEMIERMSTEDLAREAYTSKATVVRMCKKIGVEKYQDLKLKLVSEAVQKIRIHQLLAEEPINQSSTYQDIIHTIPSLYEQSIHETNAVMDKNVIHRIVNRLKTAEKIEFYGTGISLAIAQTAAFKFATLGIESTAHDSVNAHYLTASPKKRVAFVTSFTGANTSMIGTARYLKETTNSYVVGIVGRFNEEIRQWCDEVVLIPSRHTLLSLKVMTSCTSLIYVTDVLFSMLLSARYEQHVKTALETVSHESLRLSVDYWNLVDLPGKDEK